MSGRTQRLLTRNQMGWSSSHLNQVSELFVRFCAANLSHPQAKPALDIGAAFGIASLAAAEAGARVIANDLDETHLSDLAAKAKPYSGRLTLHAGRFPRETRFASGSIGAVHASNVFHFLNGNQLQRGVLSIAHWLEPGGKLFVQASTPFQAPFAEFIAEYDRRVANGETWPGWIEKASAWSTHKRLSQLPPSVHLLDDRVLRRVAEEAGLDVEQAFLYRREDISKSLHFDGRECVGLIARKP